MEKNIFKYTINNAWNMPIKSVTVTNDEVNLTDEETSKKTKIDINKLESILKQYKDKIDKIKIEELPNPGVMDGYVNEITIYNKTYSFDNLIFYSEEDLNENKDLNTIFTFLDELYDFFEQEDKTICDYFVLEDEND